MIHIIRGRATSEQMREMREMLETYIKLASLINIRPRQNNPSMEILDQKIREQVTEITLRLLGGV